MNLSELKIKNKFYAIFLLVCSLVSCGVTLVKKEAEEGKNWEVSLLPENKYPEMFDLHKGSNVPVYRIKIEPKSLSFECTKRNDYPHYWCVIRAKIIHNFNEYPDRIITSFMSSRNIAFINRYREYIKIIKKNDKMASMNVSYSIFGIDEKEIEPIRQFSGVFIGLETESICINWFNYFENCPNGLKKIEL